MGYHIYYTFSSFTEMRWGYSSSSLVKQARLRTFQKSFPQHSSKKARFYSDTAAYRTLRPRLHEAFLAPFIAQILDSYEVTQ